MKDAEPRLDKSHFSVASLDDEPDEKRFWWSRSPEDRLAALEYLRQVTYGYDPVTERLQRFFEVVEQA